MNLFVSIQRSKVFGWFTEQEELISSISVYPFKVNIHGRVYEMGGLTGVGTYPEYANAGLMNDLIMLSLEEMREDKQYISYLYPYSIPYYRHKVGRLKTDTEMLWLLEKIIPTEQPFFSDYF